MRLYKENIIMSAKGATGDGQPVNVVDYKYITLAIASDGGGDADLTVKFQGSATDGATAGLTPDFGSAQSVTNHWDYVEVIDLNSGDPIDGDTGFPFSGADDYRLFAVNVDKLKYFNARITSYSAGELTIKAIFFSE